MPWRGVLAPAEAAPGQERASVAHTKYGDRVQLAVLGPVALVSAGSLVALGGPKQRLVLGLLAASRGRVVPVDELIDGLWPDGPQAQPRKTVQVYVTRLRRALGDHADAISSEAAGYRLDPAAIDVDADSFERAVAAALGDDDDEGAAATLRAALGAWRGDAFVDLRECAAIVPAAVQLDEGRLTALHELFARELRLRPHSVLAEIEHAAGAHPLDETFAAQLMTAQYLVGRQADALGTYQQVRRRLADELGVDPGPDLRDLQGRILRHELPTARTHAPVEPARQRRRVTIIEIGFAIGAVAGEEPDAEEEFALLAPLRQLSRSRIAGHGGVVVSETGDSLTASFGYPSRGDAPVQAVAAALSIRDLADGVDKRLETRIGVDTGIAVVEADPSGATGGTLTGITGPPLRTARSLRASAAAGTVRLGGVISELVARDFELAEHPDGGTVAGPRRQRGSRARTTGQLLGHDHAISAVLDVIEDSSAGVRTVAVAGPPGIGKTSVVTEVLSHLDAGWAVTHLHGDRVHEPGALQPFRAEFPSLFDDGAEPTSRQLIAALLDSWDQRRRALVVDDFDAIDPASFELLDSLADHAADVAVVLTTRNQGPLELCGGSVTMTTLRPLDRVTARQLARRAAGPRTIGLSTLNEIAERSGGNPWHVLELTEAALGAELADDAVPTSLYDSLTWRLDRLGPSRSLAQRCSVLGGSFSTADVRLVADPGVGDAALHEQLAAMVTGGILREAGEDRFRFTHALVADIAYESLLTAERAAIHALVADELASRGRASEPAVLAYHLEASGRYRDAAEAWRRASSVAIHRSRNVDAQHHARRSLRIIDEHLDDGRSDGHDEAELTVLRRRALLNLAFGLQATQHGSTGLAEVITQTRTDGGLPVGSAVTLDMIEVSNRQALGDFAGAAEIARSTVEVFGASVDGMSTAFAHQFLGATLVWTGELGEGSEQLQVAADYWNSDAAADAGRLGARPLGALWALLGLVGCFRAQPDDDVARDIARATAVIPDDDGDGRCLVAATTAVIDQLGGRATAVRHGIDPVWALAMDLGSEFWMRWAQSLLGWAMAAEDGPAGRAMIAEVIDTQPIPQTLPYFAYLLGSRLGEADLLDEAQQRLSQGVDVAEATGERLWLPLLQLEQARCLSAAGDEAGAVAKAAEAVATAEPMGNALVGMRAAAWGLVR